MIIGEFNVGPVHPRRFHLAKTCHSSETHQHNYDHSTIVLRGRLLLITSDPDGTEVSRQEYGWGEWFDMKAYQHHTLKALEDGTVYDCVFSHRDFDGQVSQRFVGNSEAYEQCSMNC